MHYGICANCLLETIYVDWIALLRRLLIWIRAPFARKRKRTNNRAQCTLYSRTYHIAQWSSRLDWSKFVYRDEYRNDKKCYFLRVFVKKKNTHKTREIVEVAVINDNNNFAPSLFRSLCEFVGDCFGPRYFSSGAALPQKNTSVQNNHLRFHTMTSKKMVRIYYCLNSKCSEEASQIPWVFDD